jgi:hypothetical protein
MLSNITLTSGLNSGEYYILSLADQYLLPYSRVYEESSDFDLFKCNSQYLI